MTKEDIIRMAKDAGVITNSPYIMPYDHVMHGLERFASLVAAAERERLVSECIDLVAFHGGSVDLEAAIRARGNA